MNILRGSPLNIGGKSSIALFKDRRKTQKALPVGLTPIFHSTPQGDCGTWALRSIIYIPLPQWGWFHDLVLGAWLWGKMRQNVRTLTTGARSSAGGPERWLPEQRAFCLVVCVLGLCGLAQLHSGFALRQEANGYWISHAGRTGVQPQLLFLPPEKTSHTFLHSC